MEGFRETGPLIVLLEEFLLGTYDLNKKQKRTETRNPLLVRRDMDNATT